jgi:alkylation response protein AidB-like acyl-CoA dehydrogenase
MPSSGSRAPAAGGRSQRAEKEIQRPVTTLLPDFDLSEEQLEFRASLRRFLEDEAPLGETRRVMDSDPGWDAALWRRLCEELGLAGLAVAEVHGGQGFGLAELSIACAEIGRCLAPTPLFGSSALAGRVIAAVVGEAEAGEWLEPIAQGAVASLAWVEAAGTGTLEEVRCEARRAGAGVRLYGEKHCVLDARAADRFFVVARESQSEGLSGLGLFVLEEGTAGASVAPVESFDPTRRLARLHLDAAAARPVGVVGEVAAGLVRGFDEATVLLCAEIVGGMEKVLETAVDYARERHQFGRPIGSFQAIKHKCADMLIDFEGARTATRAALAAADEDDPERSLLACVAKAHAGPAYVRATTENIQIHGGVGYTWEYDAHLYYRRACSSSTLLGDAVVHRERLARSLAESVTEGVAQA